MKKIIFFFGIVLFTITISCGPSQEEQEKQNKTDDSLMEPERDAAIDKANALLTDTAIVAGDSINKK